MIDTNNIEELRFHTETQLFDRKSARIDAKALANLIIAFANADGGDAAIGNPALWKESAAILPSCKSTLHPL